MDRSIDQLEISINYSQHPCIILFIPKAEGTEFIQDYLLINTDDDLVSACLE
jgi:hypothetical protein